MSTPSSQFTGTNSSTGANVSKSSNPLLAATAAYYPLFDQIGAEHVLPAVEALALKVRLQLQHIEKATKATFHDVVEPLEDIDEWMQDIWGPVSHLNSVANSPELRAVYEKAQEIIVQLSLEIEQNATIYKRLKQIKSSENWAGFHRSQQRIIELFIRNAEFAGVHLEGERKSKFNELTAEHSRLATQFMNNIQDATKSFKMVLTSKDEVEGLTIEELQLAANAYNRSHEKDKATAENGPWQFSIDTTSFTPFMRNAKRRDLREKLYRAYVSKASSGEFNNEPVIERILTVSQEKAEILGYSNYADYSLSAKMAGDTKTVRQLLLEVKGYAKAAAVKEMQDLQAFAKSQGFNEEFRHWDISFWAERLKENKFHYNDDELKKYFPIDQVLQGLFALVKDIFQIHVSPSDGEVPLWHPDVRFFKIYDQQNVHIASFYYDPFSRPASKRGGAWVNVCRQRRIKDGGFQVPVAYIVCNSTPAIGDGAAELTFGEVRTLFHEFGHALQHMLTTIDHSTVAGIAGVEWDAVELASQFMENFLYQPNVITSISKHVVTKKHVPDDLLQRLISAKNYRAGSLYLRQVGFGLTDLELYENYLKTHKLNAKSVFDVYRHVHQDLTVLPMMSEDRFLCSFGHIFAGGYSAGYYSYLWAEVLSADAYEAFAEVSFNRQKLADVGMRFRNTVLAMGGGEHPMEVFKAFRGREPSVEPLLRHSGLKPAV